MKKQIDIEKLLKWAYCEELPKGGAHGGGAVSYSSWCAVAGLAELGTLIDDNSYGVVPDLTSSGEPDPDAITVHAAVASLDECKIDLPENWNPMPELVQFEGLGRVALDAAKEKLFLTYSDGRMTWRRPPSHLIRKHAILGGAPEGFGEVPQKQPLRGENGGELWFRMKKHMVDTVDGGTREFRYEADDGWDARRKVPKRGAYRKYKLTPDPVNAVIARQEYALWLECLDALSVKLTRTLSGFRVEKPRRPVAPWRSVQRNVQRQRGAIFPDLKFFS